MKIESIFPPTVWPDIRHDTSDEAGDDEYQGRLYWKYCEIQSDGSFGKKEEEYEIFDFLSYKYNAKSHSAYGENQEITNALHISDGAT